MRINKTLLDKVSLKQISKTTFYRDDALKGFGLRVSLGGTRAFIVEKRVHGKVKRQTLGTFPALTCEQARKAAHQRLAEMALGVDPKAQEKAEQARKITTKFFNFSKPTLSRSYHETTPFFLCMRLRRLPLRLDFQFLFFGPFP